MNKKSNKNSNNVISRIKIKSKNFRKLLRPMFTMLKHNFLRILKDFKESIHNYLSNFRQLIK